MPVVVATTSTLRSKAPVRLSSASTRSARPCTVSALCRPAYTRIGAGAGAVDRLQLPRPSVRRARRTDRSSRGLRPGRERCRRPRPLGGGRESVLREPVVSCGAKIALAPAKKPLTMTPVHRPHRSTTTRPVPSTIDRRGGSRRPSQRTAVVASSRSPRPASNSRSATPRVTVTTTGQMSGEVGGIPNCRISFCHPTSRQPFHTAPHAPTPTSAQRATVRARPRSPGMPRYRHSAAAPAPSP